MSGTVPFALSLGGASDFGRMPTEALRCVSVENGEIERSEAGAFESLWEARGVPLVRRYLAAQNTVHTRGESYCIASDWLVIGATRQRAIHAQLVYSCFVFQSVDSFTMSQKPWIRWFY